MIRVTPEEFVKQVKKEQIQQVQPNQNSETRQIIFVPVEDKTFNITVVAIVAIVAITALVIALVMKK